MTNYEGTVGIVDIPVDPLRYERSRDLDKISKYESDALICSLVPPGARVLDVGCGQGVLMDILKQAKNAIAVGVEPNPDRAAVARSRGFEVFDGYVSTELLDRLGKFDVVLFADVLEHLPDPHAMLDMVRPYLKPDGRIVISVPNVAHWSVRLALLFGRFDYQPYGIMDATHLRWFTESGIRLLVSHSGYEVKCMRHSLGAWMGCYSRGPFRLLSQRAVRTTARVGAFWIPKLFGCQHILSAVVR